MADFGSIEGLDNVAVEPLEVDGKADGELRGSSGLEADGGAGGGLRWDSELEMPLEPEDVGGRDSPMRSSSPLLAGEVSAPS